MRSEVNIEVPIGVALGNTESNGRGNFVHRNDSMAIKDSKYRLDSSSPEILSLRVRRLPQKIFSR